MQCKKCGGRNPEGVGSCVFCGHHMDGGGGAPKTNTQEKRTLESLKQDIIAKTDILDEGFLLSAAIAFYNGIDVEKDEAFAEKIFANLAMRGNADAMFYYAQILMHGTMPNIDDARYWLEKAAESGHIAAKNTLDWLNRRGGGNSAAGSISTPKPRAEGSLEDLAADALSSILRINSRLGNAKHRNAGSGFIVDGGLVVTNSHVVGDPRADVTATFDPSVSGNTYKLELLRMDPSQDIAVLRFTGAAGDKLLKEEKSGARRFLSIRDGITHFGESVYSIGNPLGLGTSLNAGQISNPQSDLVFDYKLGYTVQTNMTVNHGESGSALMDMNNRVVGMVTASPYTEIGMLPVSETQAAPVLGGAHRMTVCIPAENIDKFIKGVK